MTAERYVVLGRKILKLGQRPRPPEQQAVIDGQYVAGVKEMNDRKLVAQGHRVVNRIDKADLERFVRAFVADNLADDYPYHPEDEALDNELPDEIWTLRQGQPVPAQQVAALAVVVRGAYARFELAAPPDEVMLASLLLLSDLGGKQCFLCDIPLSKLSVALVLGHLEALGYAFLPRVSISIARLATLVVCNRGRFQEPPTAPEATKAAP